MPVQEQNAFCPEIKRALLYLVWQFTASLSIQAELAALAYMVVFLWVVMTEKDDHLPR